MNRRKRITAIVIAMVMILSCIGVSAASSKAAFLNVTLAMYKSMPMNITMEVNKDTQIKHVVKTQFRYTGKDSFGSIEKFLNRFSGSTISVSGVKWVSSDDKVVRVDSKGKIHALKKGKAYVYPVPKGVASYKKFGYGIFYMKGAFQNGIKLYGGIGTKVKVKKVS